jgi:hypothetical protein
MTININVLHPAPCISLSGLASRMHKKPTRTIPLAQSLLELSKFRPLPCIAPNNSRIAASSHIEKKMYFQRFSDLKKSHKKREVSWAAPDTTASCVEWGSESTGVIKGDGLPVTTIVLMEHGEERDCRPHILSYYICTSLTSCPQEVMYRFVQYLAKILRVVQCQARVPLFPRVAFQHSSSCRNCTVHHCPQGSQ